MARGFIQGTGMHGTRVTGKYRTGSLMIAKMSLQQQGFRDTIGYRVSHKHTCQCNFNTRSMDGSSITFSYDKGEI